jgi:predicted nucleic acid-binding protein
MIIVVDASVAAKWFIAEENANDALELLGKNYELHAIFCSWK